MKIGIDGNEANVVNRVGTGQYTERLLSTWARNPSHDFHIYLRESPLSHMPKSSSYWHYHVIGPKKAWTRFALPVKLFSTKHDVFWNPAHYLPMYTGCKSVVTIHDLAYEFFPELFLAEDLYKLKNWTKSSVDKADKVIAVSESTKHDLVKLYGVDVKKIKVISNGYDSKLFNVKNKLPKSILNDYNLQSNTYILYIGTVQPRKNVIKLIQAFRLLKEDGYEGKLVIAGKIGWLAEDTLDIIKASPDQKDILLTGYISDEHRAALYRHADVFVLPSLYEGFGVGVLEAMASGAPVACSNNSSLPEVAGDAAALFDPTDPADIVKAIKLVKANRERFIKKGLTRVENYSWDKCAEVTLKAITSIS